MCVLWYRTPYSTLRMYRIAIMKSTSKVVDRVISPITGLSLHNAYCGASDKHSSSMPGCHIEVGGSNSLMISGGVMLT